MKKRWLIILMTVLVVFSAMDVLAEAIIETDDTATPAPTSMGALNLGITEDAKATPEPTMPPSSSGGTMMLAPGATEGGEGTTEEAAAVDTTKSFDVPESLLDANGQPPKYGKTNKKGVNVRAKTNTNSKSETRIGVTGTAVEILEITEAGKDIWFKVKYGNTTGYIRSDLLDIITEQEYVAAESAQRSSKPSSSKGSGSSSSGSSSNSNVVSTPQNTVPEQSGIHLFSECTDANCSICNSDGLG